MNRHDHPLLHIGPAPCLFLSGERCTLSLENWDQITVVGPALHHQEDERYLNLMQCHGSINTL